MILSALPVLLLTLLAALLQLGGNALNGPLPGTFFEKIGPNLSYLLPLALVMAGLIGHALRESSAGYAFGAGLVAEMAVILGYALHVTMASPPRSFQMAEFITIGAIGRYHRGGLGACLVDRAALGQCMAGRNEQKPS